MMRTMLAIAACLATASPALSQSTVPRESRVLSPFEQGIVEEHNLVRTNPLAYAAHLREFRGFFDGNLIRIPGSATAILTREGVSAVDEAIDFLTAAEPAPALEESEGMSRGATDHVEDQGPSGDTGHDGSDGSTPGERMDRHGSWNMIFAKNLAYGPQTARDVVMGLIIDDGVPDRGHRRNIFDPRLLVIGVACGPHEIYRSMCVIDYAGEFTEALPLGAIVATPSQPVVSRSVTTGPAAESPGRNGHSAIGEM